MSWHNRLILIVSVLLLSAGLVLAQSSASFVLHRFELAGGGVSTSTSYRLTGVIGQETTSLTDSAQYQLSGGFLFPNQKRGIWLPAVLR